MKQVYVIKKNGKYYSGSGNYVDDITDARLYSKEHAEVIQLTLTDTILVHIKIVEIHE